GREGQRGLRALASAHPAPCPLLPRSIHVPGPAGPRPPAVPRIRKRRSPGRYRRFLSRASAREPALVLRSGVCPAPQCGLPARTEKQLGPSYPACLHLSARVLQCLFCFSSLYVYDNFSRLREPDACPPNLNHGQPRSHQQEMGFAAASDLAIHEVPFDHQVGSGRNGAAGWPVASVSNRYTSPAVGSARRCSSLPFSVAVVT